MIDFTLKLVSIKIFLQRVNLQRILPALTKECVNADMIPFVLPSVLLMAEQSTDREYMTFIFPELKPMFKIKEPIQVCNIHYIHMEFVLFTEQFTE